MFAGRGVYGKNDTTYLDSLFDFSIATDSCFKRDRSFLLVGRWSAKDQRKKQQYAGVYLYVTGGILNAFGGGVLRVT